MKFDVFARAGCHRDDPDMKKLWLWMDEREAENADDAARAIHDETKARYPADWEAWTLADFKAEPNPGVPFGEPGYPAAYSAMRASRLQENG